SRGRRGPSGPQDRSTQSKQSDPIGSEPHASAREFRATRLWGPLFAFPTFGRAKMLDRAMLAILFLLSALNVITLAVNFSQQSRAGTARMSYQQLMSDPDFVRAVESVAEACRVNVHLAKVKC